MKTEVLTQRMNERLQGKETYGEYMTRLSRLLEVPDKTLRGASLRHDSEIVERRPLGLEYFEQMRDGMDYMLQERAQGKEETLWGPIFTTGLNGTIAAEVLLPRGRGRYENVVTNNPKQAIDGQDVIAGTPMVIMIRDQKAAEEIRQADHTERIKIFNRILQEKGKRVKEGKSLSAVSAGGWGHQPPAFTRRGELILLTKRYDQKPYEIAFLPGYFGSMNSLDPRLIRDPKAMGALKQSVRLGTFAGQVEQSLVDIAQILSPGINDPKEMAKYFPLLAGHSMGGYLILALSRPRTGLRVIDAMKESKKSIFFADKAVMVGKDYPVEQMPTWMREIVESPGYRTHVPLQDGWKGAAVRLGVSRKWGEYEYIEELRTALLKRRGAVPGVSEIFSFFLDPKNIYDGHNVDLAHAMSYAYYRAFHELCVAMLDSADPIIGKETMPLMSGNDLYWLRILYGVNGDRVLNHDILQSLTMYLAMRPYETRGDKDIAHHLDYDEIKWMLEVDEHGKKAKIRAALKQKAQQ